MGKYDEFLLDLVKPSGGALASKLRSALVEKYGVSKDNARKIIERASTDQVLKSSAPLSFGKGQFLYVDGKKKISLKKVRDFSNKTRPPLFRLLVLLEINGGVVCRYEALKVTSSPDERTSTKVSLLSDIIEDLSILGFVTERLDGNGINYIVTQPAIKETEKESYYLKIMARHYEYMKLDTCFTPDILKWLRESNLASNAEYSYRGMKTPGLGALHNNISWDAYTYTKTTGLNASRASDANSVDKQTFLALDIVVARPYEQIDLDGFYSRVQIHRNSVREIKKRAVIPVIVYREIEDRILNSARMLGFLTYRLDQLYGKEVSKVLDKLKSLFVPAEQSSTENFDFEEALEIIDQSGHSEQLKALRGVLFESLMYPFISRFYPNAIIQRDRILYDPLNKKLTREFDYIIYSSNPAEIVLIELKGYPSTSSIALGKLDKVGTVKYFFEGSVPLAIRHFKADMIFGNTPIKSIFITTGGYYEDSEAYLSTLSGGNLKPNDFDLYYDGSRLLEALVKYEFNHDAAIIRRFYQRKQKDFSE